MDYYTALRKAGLGQYVPTSYKQRRFTSSSNHATYSKTNRTATSDWQRYQQTVWPEYAFGTSFEEAMKPSTPSQLKAMHDYASSVFSKAIAQLQAFGRAGRW